jgi:hypothetical protein
LCPVWDIGSWINNDGSLVALNLGSNLFSGSIGREIGHLSTLMSLVLSSSNAFTGSIPSELGLLSLAVVIFLDDHQLTGQIPSSLIQLTSLGKLCRNKQDAFLSVVLLPTPFLMSQYLLVTLQLELNDVTGSLEEVCDQSLERFKNGEAFSLDLIFVQVPFDQFNFGADCPEEVSCRCCTTCCDSQDNCDIA